MRATASMLRLALFGILLAGPWTFSGEPGGWISHNEARAVVGRPLTPASVAGVARRTSRRTARRNAAYYGAGAATTVVTTLPAGCATTSVGGVTQYTCGSTRYRPYYDGPDLVYVSVQ